MGGFFQQEDLAGSPLSRVSENETMVCHECGLMANCLTPKMPVHGCGNSGVMIVAEAPGEKEDRQGIPLIGKAGQRLRDLLDELDVELDVDCWKTNAVVCRPPANAKPTSRQIELCRRRLFENIRQFDPSVVILLGECAVESVIGAEWGEALGALYRWVGKTIPSRRFNAWLCPVYHPSYLMRTEDKMPVLRTLVSQQLENAFDLCGKPRPFGDGYELPRLQDPIPIWEQREIEILWDPVQVAKRLRRFRKAGGIIAFDYETTGLKPYGVDHKIVSCSVCRHGEETISFLLGDEGGIVANGLRKLLTSPEVGKVAANKKFETLWTLWKLGVDVVGWVWDTMLMSHYLDNRINANSLKFQTYTHFGVGDYASKVSKYLKAKGASEHNRIMELVKEDPESLLMYGGLDSLFEHKLFGRQREAYEAL